MKRMHCGILAGVLAGVGGCEVVHTPTLPANAFVANQPVIGSAAGDPIDQPGALVYGAEHRTPKPVASDGTSISKTVRESVTTPSVETLRARGGADLPPTGPVLPATNPGKTAVSTGEWQWVGSVLAVVNDQPIYAHKVVNALDRALAAEARSGNEEHFKQVAEDLVLKQIKEFIDNELEYAAAQRSLEKNDEQIARYVTGEWRKEQVRKAGGSEALARQRALEDGQDFEEEVQQQYRLNMTRLYYQRKIIPLIQITAQDMRDFYQANIRNFEKVSAARFRVIFISSEKTGGREAALEKARRQVYEPAKAGADFAVLASKINDDPGLMASRGAVGDDKGWMEKGAYAQEKVEQAVWEHQAGQVTEPIDASFHGQGGFFVAKVEELRLGRSEPFESQQVQDEIRETLRREQFAKLREAHRRDLVQKAVIRENPNMHDAAMQMVMQRYHTWVASR